MGLHGEGNACCSLSQLMKAEVSTYCFDHLWPAEHVVLLRSAADTGFPHLLGCFPPSEATFPIFEKDASGRWLHVRIRAVLSREKKRDKAPRGVCSEKLFVRCFKCTGVFAVWEGVRYVLSGMLILIASFWTSLHEGRGSSAQRYGFCFHGILLEYV